IFPDYVLTDFNTFCLHDALPISTPVMRAKRQRAVRRSRSAKNIVFPLVKVCLKVRRSSLARNRPRDWSCGAGWLIRGSTFRWMPAVDAPASVDRVTSVPETAAELPPESAGVRAVFAQLQVALHVLVA